MGETVKLELNVFLDWLLKAKWTQVLMLLVLSFSGIAAWTVYENRQKVYDRIAQPISSGDWPLEYPEEETQKVFVEFARTHPGVALMSVIDADPVKNKRSVVYRYFNNEAVKSYVSGEEAQGRSGNGLLYGVDPETNRQTLAIFNAQVSCEDSSKGFFAKIFPDVPKFVGTSCRIPLPPIYGLTTGWISIHIVGTQHSGTDPQFVMELMNLAEAYYKLEILPRQR